MTVNGRQLAIQPKFREAKLGILCVGTKFDWRHLSPFCQVWEKMAEVGKNWSLELGTRVGRVDFLRMIRFMYALSMLYLGSLRTLPDQYKTSLPAYITPYYKITVG